MLISSQEKPRAGFIHLSPVLTQMTFNVNGKQKLFLIIENYTQKDKLVKCRFPRRLVIKMLLFHKNYIKYILVMLV